jgi:hypothetical protein
MRDRIFFFLAAALVALGINGCGGEGKSYDPLGTDSLTFGDSTGSSALQLDPNGAVQLTAKVKDTAGKAVAEREVTFLFVTNASGATLTSGAVNTNIAGEATILYRAGTVSGIDVIRALISNDAKMDVSITVGGSSGGAQVALAGSPATLSAGQKSILTATVTNASGAPLKGQTVTFAFATNSSGGELITLSETTDASGKAVAQYTAGAANPTASVQDTVQASVAGSASVLLITRTAAGSGGAANLAIASSATSLVAGQIAVITATVTDTAGAPVSGQAVTFAFSANNSGGELLTLSRTTDASGRAVAQYTAGASSPATSVQDTILASASGSTATIAITRAVGVAPGFQMDVTATNMSPNAGEVSIIVATVRNMDGTAAPGQTVTFAFSGGAAPSGATLIPNNGITDVSGKALSIYTAGTLSPSVSVQDAVLVRASGTAGVVIITRPASSVTGNRISSLTAVQPLLSTSTGSTVVTATVVQADGVTPVSGATVTFSLAKGLGTITPPAVVTNGSGQANAIFIGPGNATAGFDAIQAKILDAAGGSVVVIINWLP